MQDEVIGFTDEEVARLNEKQINGKQTATRTSGTRTERPSTKQAKLIGNLGGASLSKPRVPEPSSEATQTKLPVDNNQVSNPGHIEDDNPFKADEEQPTPPHLEQPSEQPSLTKLEELQVAQAKLESANREKQAILKQSITEKFARTAEQAKSLASLQQEVAAVEKELNCDISLLRDRIDHCNRRYTEASKRLSNAEAEYVAAKLDLHHCRELKEGLEEHLFTIIKLNETKKSERLEALYRKLECLSATLESPS